MRENIVKRLFTQTWLLLHFIPLTLKPCKLLLMLPGLCLDYLSSAFSRQVSCGFLVASIIWVMPFKYLSLQAGLGAGVYVPSSQSASLLFIQSFLSLTLFCFPVRFWVWLFSYLYCGLFHGSPLQINTSRMCLIRKTIQFLDSCGLIWRLKPCRVFLIKLMGLPSYIKTGSKRKSKSSQVLIQHPAVTKHFNDFLSAVLL